MVFTAPTPTQLPNISQVLDMIRGAMAQMPVRHRMPYDEPVENPDVFLLNRTASGLFTLKPNITMQPCLFYGDNSYHQMKQPAWNALRRNDWMIQNVLREEFELVMCSHPLHSLFIEGIPTSVAHVRIINPFGLAMAYGFPAPMLPLTSSLDVAAFFATHTQDTETGRWTPIPECNAQGEPNVGVLYMMELALPFPMIAGLSCIGMQAFQRPGVQRMYGLNIGAGENFNRHRLVRGLQFRQQPAEVQEISRKFTDGAVLTPDELIARKARAILTGHQISEAAFAYNCKGNPQDDPNVNRKRLQAAGYEIIPEQKLLFTEEELNEQFYPTAEEQWNAMFCHVVAVHPGFDKILYDLRKFPETQAGKQFFRK